MPKVVPAQRRQADPLARLAPGGVVRSPADRHPLGDRLLPSLEHPLVREHVDRVPAELPPQHPHRLLRQRHGDDLARLRLRGRHVQQPLAEVHMLPPQVAHVRIAQAGKQGEARHLRQVLRQRAEQRADLLIRECRKMPPLDARHRHMRHAVDLLVPMRVMQDGAQQREVLVGAGGAELAIGAQLVAQEGHAAGGDLIEPDGQQRPQDAEPQPVRGPAALVARVLLYPVGSGLREWSSRTLAKPADAPEFGGAPVVVLLRGLPIGGASAFSNRRAAVTGELDPPDGAALVEGHAGAPWAAPPPGCAAIQASSSDSMKSQRRPTRCAGTLPARAQASSVCSWQ